MARELKKDQLLFTIDPRPYQAQLDSRSGADWRKAKAALDLANTQLKMYASIADTRAVSQLDFETKKNTVAVDEAQVQAAEAAVENAKLNLEYCYIRSPIDGRAGARMVDVGNVVQANTTGLLLIQQLDPIYADFTVTESDLPEVQRQMAQGTLKTVVRIPSDDGERGARGQADVPGQRGAERDRHGELAGHDSQRRSPFLAGTIRERTVDSGDAEGRGADSEPGRADQPARPFVYVVKPDDTVELRLVTLGQRQGDDVVVTKGVAAGERVVVTGQLTLHPGRQSARADRARRRRGATRSGARRRSGRPSRAGSASSMNFPNHLSAVR